MLGDEVVLGFRVTRSLHIATWQTAKEKCFLRNHCPEFFPAGPRHSTSVRTHLCIHSYIHPSIYPYISRYISCTIPQKLRRPKGAARCSVGPEQICSRDPTSQAWGKKVKVGTLKGPVGGYKGST